MIISRAPYRISFFGGGTDYPKWYLKEGGSVLSTSIDKYCYITCRFLPPFFNIKHRIVWSKVETVGSLAEIQHPVVPAALKYMGFDDSSGFEIHHQGDLPARSGIGSSSAFTVALLKALSALRGTLVTKQQLALSAIEVEQNILKESVGSQDQVAAAYGGLNRIDFLPSGEIRVEPLTIQLPRVLNLESNLMLFYTGISRTASQIASSVINNLSSKKDELTQMRGFVDQAIGVLSGKNSIDEFGELLHKSWMLKRELSPKVSSTEIDDIYATARKAGAVGGKLLGAGGSGFLMFYVPTHKQPAVRTALGGLLQVPFRFENQGASLVHYGNDFTDRVLSG